MTACPQCGSRFLRPARATTAKERFRKLLLIEPLRCLDCKSRFVARTFIFSDLFYARCPCCHRMDLNRWTGATYEPPFLVGLKVFFGAGRWRCEYCRLNFASFRARKEVFSFSRGKKQRPA